MSQRTTNVIIGIVIAALLIVMLSSWDNSRDEAVAEAKAAELVTAYRSAGIVPRLGAKQLANSLGDDGGAVCDVARNLSKSDTYRGYLKLQYGVGGEFYFRPSEIDTNALERARIVVETYCPEEIPGLRALIDGVETSDVIKE